jgi:ELWxxDGT repeat protein
MKNILLALLITASVNTLAQTPQLVIDVNPGLTSATPLMLTVFNGKLYFSATDPTYGRELFVYNGVNTPSMVYNLYPGNPGGLDNLIGTNAVAWNNKLYFSGSDGSSGGFGELMSYDGTNPPSLEQDINPGAPAGAPSRFVSYNDKLYFCAINAGSGYEFYKYDGVNTPAMIDLNVGLGSGMSSVVMPVEYNGKIYFSGDNGTTGKEPYQYDPSNNTITLVEDINAAAANSSPSGFTVYNNKLYFTAYSGIYGRELYSYDGTNTLRLTDVATGLANGVQDNHVIGYNGYIYFSGTITGSDAQLYKYDPSNNTTSLVYNINPTGSANITNFILYANKIYFGANDGTSGNELWMHDGNTTSMVYDLNPGSAGTTTFDRMVIYNNALYYTTNDGITGSELYSLTDPAAGIKSVWLNGNISIAPNPTSGDATLQFSLKQENKLSIQITDATGKLVYEKENTRYPAGNTDVIIPLSGQAASLYFYNVKDNTGKVMASGKIQKQ